MARRPLLPLLFALMLVVTGPVLTVPVFAQEATPAETVVPDPSDPEADQVDATQKDIEAKQRRVKALDELIAQYRTRIQQQTATAETLQAQLALLDTRAEAQALRVRRAREELDRLALEISRAEQQQKDLEATLTVRRALLSEVLAELERAPDSSPILALFGKKSLSTYVARRAEVRALQQALTAATVSVHEAKMAVEAKRLALQVARTGQLQETQALELAQHQLEDDRAAKRGLIAETGNREDQFRRLVADLQREQQGETEAVSALRDRLRDSIGTSDDVLARGDLLLTWPIEAKKGISAHFHDATYPFRNLFEHPGTDLPTPVGTPVRAAAGGYVAWNRVGRQYGNYIMVIHPNGIATVYAHLSAFAAKPDTYVERGEVIGYSGGRPGDPGAGLSTGPHLHFEVRQDGVPVNPELFLPEL